MTIDTNEIFLASFGMTEIAQLTLGTGIDLLLHTIDYLRWGACEAEESLSITFGN